MSVYFIQEGENGPIKVGHAANPLHRLASLQTGNPRELRLVGSIPGGAKDEKRIHEWLSPWWIRGEWFHPDPEVLRAASGQEEADGAELGAVHYAPGCIVLDDRARYEIALDECRTDGQIWGWVEHLREKPWVTEAMLATFVRLARGLEYRSPQA